MALSTVCFLAIALFAAAQPALSRPDSKQGAPDVNQLLKEFQTTVEKSIADVRKSVNLPENPSGAEVVKALREQGDKAEKTLADIKTKIEEGIKKNPEISGALKNMESKINEAKEKLKKENPEAAANVQKAVDGLKGAYETMAKEFQKINDEVNKKGGVRDDLDNLMKNLIDRGSAAAKDLQAKIQEATKADKKA